MSTSEEESESSEDESQISGKKRKLESGPSKAIMVPKRKKQLIKKPVVMPQTMNLNIGSFEEAEEVAMVERRLEARNSLLAPESIITSRVPQEIFSNEPSLDSGTSNYDQEI